MKKTKFRLDNSLYIFFPATPHKSGRMSVAVVANHANHIIANYYTMGAI